MRPLNNEFAKALGWKEEPSEEGMGPLWDQWAKVWCESLQWKKSELNKWTGIENKSFSEEVIKTLYPSVPSTDLNRHMALLQFYSMFRSCYKEARQKKKKNNDLNFKNKRWFIYLIIYTILAHILLSLLFVILYWVLHFSGKQLLAIEAFVLFVPVMVAIVIGKNLDINKYQETWSRHTQFQYLRDQEMLCFLLHSEPYKAGEDADKVERFVKAILEIEGKNITKFCENMDTKEKGVLDEVLSILKKKD